MLRMFLFKDWSCLFVLNDVCEQSGRTWNLRHLFLSFIFFVNGLLAQWTQQNRIKASVFSCVKHVQALMQCCMITVSQIKDGVYWHYITLTNKTDFDWRRVSVYVRFSGIYRFLGDKSDTWASRKIRLSQNYLECSIECLKVIRLVVTTTPTLQEVRRKL